MYHLGRRVREKLAGSDDPRDRPVLDLNWNYTTEVENGVEEPSAESVLCEINGYDSEGNPLDDYLGLKDDGSTACGCWIYSGVYKDGVNQAARRKPWKEQTWVAPEWGWAWPMNRRILYNRASADPEGKPWSERKKYVWWDEEETKWVGQDVPDFLLTKPPDYVPEEGAFAEAAHRGDKPFVMQPDGTGWLYVPVGVDDGPLPTHYEPEESPFDNPLYGQRSNPPRERFPRHENPYNPAGSMVFPHVLTTYRLTEHHTAGGMSRSTQRLSKLMPEMFCEVSPELAEEAGLENGGWATIITTRTAIEARVLVTDRLAPLRVQGQDVNLVGLPYHWGNRGLVRGDSANDLLGLALDPNVHIGEYKASTCAIRPGRRPRGPALLEFVEDYRRRSTSEENGGTS